jgi:hypothetical protein
MQRTAKLRAIARFLWTATRGYRLRPWTSPYLRWRIETYQGRPADRVDARYFHRFTWRHRRELWRFLCWAGEMGASARSSKAASGPHA